MITNVLPPFYGFTVYLRPPDVKLDKLHEMFGRSKQGRLGGYRALSLLGVSTLKVLI